MPRPGHRGGLDWSRSACSTADTLSGSQHEDEDSSRLGVGRFRRSRRHGLSRNWSSASLGGTYSLLHCVNTRVFNVKVCIYRSQQNYNILQGQFQNGSDVGISNNGVFQYSNGATAYNCGESVTGAHLTSFCTVSFPRGNSVRLKDTYSYNGGRPSVYTNFFPT